MERTPCSPSIMHNKYFITKEDENERTRDAGKIYTAKSF